MAEYSAKPMTYNTHQQFEKGQWSIFELVSIKELIFVQAHIVPFFHTESNLLFRVNDCVN